MLGVGTPTFRVAGSALRCEENVYRCFEKGCPTKPYAIMPKVIMSDGGSWSLVVRRFSDIEGNNTNKCIYAFLFLLVNTVNLNQSTPNFFYP